MSEEFNIENIISILLCHTCGAPPNNKKPSIYMCKNGKHCYCEVCFKKDKYNCEDLIDHPLLSSIIEILPLYCINFKRGCRHEIVGEKDNHERTCKFQITKCLYPKCSENLKFSELFDHMKSTHNEIMPIEKLILTKELGWVKARK